MTDISVANKIIEMADISIEDKIIEIWPLTL